MPITREAFFDAGGATATRSVSVTSNAAGDTLLVCVRWHSDTETLSSVTVQGESNATILGSPQQGGPSSAHIQWAILSNVTGTGTKLVEATLPEGPASLSLCVWRLRGCDTSGANDNVAGAAGATSVPTVNVTTTQAGAALFGVAINDDHELTADSGFTGESLGDYLWFESGEYDIDAGAAGSKAVSFATSAVNAWTLNAIAIKPAAGGGAPRKSLSLLGCG